MNTPMISSRPIRVTEVLNDLLDDELNSVFRVLADNAPYLGRSAGAIRQPLAEIEKSCLRRANELADLIVALNGTPIARGLQSQQQNLGYLSLSFLLPKLIAAKEIAVQRWTTALSAVTNRSTRAKALLENQLYEHEIQLLQLMRAAKTIAKS
jgi:bacterioferritin (cytochrome b1)